MPRSLILLSLFFSWGLSATSAQDKKPAAKSEPRILLALPLGVEPGKTTKLILRGANLDSATDCKLLKSDGAVKVEGKGKAAVPDKNPDKVGDTQVEIELKLDASFSAAAIELVVITPTGESPPHTVLVDSGLPVVAEKEPNDSFRTAPTAVLPLVLAGTIQRPKDVDLFRLDGKQGQKISAEILASRHGSPLDPILTLYDAKFQQVAVSDDFVKDHRDAKLEMTLPADGVYYLALIDAHDMGSNLHVYRLLVK